MACPLCPSLVHSPCPRFLRCLLLSCGVVVIPPSGVFDLSTRMPGGAFLSSIQPPHLSVLCFAICCGGFPFTTPLPCIDFIFPSLLGYLFGPHFHLLTAALREGRSTAIATSAIAMCRGISLPLPDGGHYRACSFGISRDSEHAHWRPSARLALGDVRRRARWQDYINTCSGG